MWCLTFSEESLASELEQLLGLNGGSLSVTFDSGNTISIGGLAEAGIQRIDLYDDMIDATSEIQSPYLSEAVPAVSERVEVWKWKDGTSERTNFTLQPGQRAAYNDRDQFIIHGGGGQAPIFVQSDGTQITLTAPEESQIIDPWILVAGLNDNGEVAGSLFDPAAADPDSAAFQAYSWHMGNYLFTGIYDDSSAHALSNAGFLSLGTKEEVAETLQTRLGVLTPANDLNQNSLPDDWESFYNVSDPQGDPDNDNLKNWAEYIHFTNPRRADSDSDALGDYLEISLGKDPAWSYDGDLASDVDEDGLSLQTEIELGTNPGAADSDGDGLRDDYEVANFLDPLDADTDDDGVTDGTEVANGTNPKMPEGNGIPNAAQHLMAAFMHVEDRPQFSSSLSVSVDADRDGMPDSWEITHGLNPEDPEDAWRDFDYDRIINRTEFELGLNPVCDWSFVPIAGDGLWSSRTQQWGGPYATLAPAGYQTLRGDGSLLSVKPGATTFEVKKWKNGVWTPDGDLGLVGNFDAVAQIVASESGMVAAVVGKSLNFRSLEQCELRIRDPEGNLTVLGTDDDWPEVTSGWKNVVSLWVTESGFIAGIATSGTNYGSRAIPFRWRNGNLEIFGSDTDNGDFSPDFYEAIGIDERGVFAHRIQGLLIGTEWQNQGKYVEAIGPYGKIWTSPFPENPNSWELRRSPDRNKRIWMNLQGDRLSGFIQTPTGYSFDENGSYPWGLNANFQRGPQAPSLTISGEIDSDGDNWSDYAENQYGTNPSDPSSFPSEDSEFHSAALFIAGMNDLGDVVGHRKSIDAVSLDQSLIYQFPNEGFLWRHQDFSLMGGLGDESRFWAINNSGHILVTRTTYEPEIDYYDSNADGIQDPDEPSFETGNETRHTTWGMLVPQNEGPDVAQEDKNGLPGDWEEMFGVSDPDGDPDRDTLSNRLEYILGTHPRCSDTDQDGGLDHVELALGRNPLKVNTDDLDFDGLSNDLELLLGSDPNLFDSDGDGLPDWWEYLNAPFVDLTTHDSDSDLDNDGLVSGYEYVLGLNVSSNDTDGDGAIDGMEVNIFGTDPNLAADFQLFRDQFYNNIDDRLFETTSSLSLEIMTPLVTDFNTEITN